ncbi:MAG TPA: hypothetical protein VKB57_13610 [Acidimicrobiales bacterium]|nr:hypothetical protein [Acidimicrobiales bacterium]
MPEDTANIRFGFDAADAAADELLLTAQSLFDSVSIMRQDIPVVTDDWTGRFREVFDVESAVHDLAMTRLAGELTLLSAQLRAMAIEAAAAWAP